MLNVEIVEINDTENSVLLKGTSPNGEVLFVEFFECEDGGIGLTIDALDPQRDPEDFLNDPAGVSIDVSIRKDGTLVVG